MFYKMEDYNNDAYFKKFGRDITQAVKDGKVDPVIIGRDGEIRRMVKIL